MLGRHSDRTYTSYHKHSLVSLATVNLIMLLNRNSELFFSEEECKKHLRDSYREEKGLQNKRKYSSILSFLYLKDRPTSGNTGEQDYVVLQLMPAT